MSEDVRASFSRLMRGLNHDLKNPLGAADGYVDLLLQGYRGELNEEQRQTLERVRTLIATGIAILEDVVSFARAELGELRVRPGDTDLGSVARMAMDRHRKRADEARIALEFDGASGPVRAVTDPDLVGQVVDRLLANALDYAPDGGRVRVATEAHGDRVRVLVRDDGPGVPPEDRERLLLPFEKGSAPARARETAGIGFGLSLAHALAQRLGGELRVDGAEDGGTVVMLELPKAARDGAGA